MQNNYLKEIEIVTENISKFLKEKNKRYGNSALEPLRVFSSHVKGQDQAFDNMLVRLDDKLSRISCSKEFKENDVVDLIGYLILICVHLGWNNFDKFLD